MSIWVYNRSLNSRRQIVRKFSKFFSPWVNFLFLTKIKWQFFFFSTGRLSKSQWLEKKTMEFAEKIIFSHAFINNLIEMLSIMRNCQMMRKSQMMKIQMFKLFLKCILYKLKYISRWDYLVSQCFLYQRIGKC